MNAIIHVPLGEVCVINPRVSRVASLCRDPVVSFIPMSAVDERIGEITGQEKRSLSHVSKGYTSFENGDILFAKITPCMENGKVAMARNLINGAGRGSTEFYVLRPSEHIIGEYLYHVVRQSHFREIAKRNFTGTAGQQRVPRSFMEKVLIPLPPLDDQRRMADIFNRATHIERMRVKAIDCFRYFAPALFVNMFGDFAENPMRYKVKPLGEICEIVGGGTPKRSNKDYFDGDIPWATPTDVTALSGFLIEDTGNTITEAGLKKSSARLVPAGTVLMTSRATIGRTAIAAKPMATNQGFANLVCGEHVVPEYMSLFLQNQKEKLISLASGTTFKEISKTTLKKFETPVPPLKMQHHLKTIVRQADRVISATNHAARNSSNLVASLVAHLLKENR